MSRSDKEVEFQKKRVKCYVGLVMLYISNPECFKVNQCFV